jgi:outer membrane protein OmpA-like peptidoglycan-associated protein
MKQFGTLTALAFCGAFSLCAFAQATDQKPTSQAKATASTESNWNHVASGQKQKITGVIIKRDPDSFVIRDPKGQDTTILLSNGTKVSEMKSNPFRGAKSYPVTALLRGLNLEVEGRGDASGNLSADKIKFNDQSYQMARTVESRVTPVEGRVGEAETRLSEAETNAQRLSGQIEELSAVSNAARGGAKAAQDTADAAIAGVNATNERIGMLDDFDAKKSASIQFKVGSAVLSPEAMASLDDLATQAKTEKGFVIQIAGFASADGSEDLNRRLSQRRADAVVRYLAEKQDVPLRRIVTPFGYGEMKPVADNTTREGREQNRRVEVTVMVSKGLNSASPQMNKSAEGASAQAKENH